MRVITIFLLLVCLGACFLKKNISQPPKSTLTAQDSICLEMQNIIRDYWQYDSINKAYNPKKEFWVLVEKQEKYKNCFETIDTNQIKKLFGNPVERNDVLKIFSYPLMKPCKDLCDHCIFLGVGYKFGKLQGFVINGGGGDCN